MLVLKRDGVGTFAENVIAHEHNDIIVKIPFSVDSDIASAFSAYGVAYIGMKKLVMENKG